MKDTWEVVICGGGIAGISAAYFLAVRNGLHRILLIDERPPFSLTSDKSSECYRNWWPGPDSGMVELMNRSIDLMEALADESGDFFYLNRRGYLYVTADPEKAAAMPSEAQAISDLGAGPLRSHPGNSIYDPESEADFRGAPYGADLILDPGLIRYHYPYLTDKVVAALHVRRAGWFSGQQLGMFLLEQARMHGVELTCDRVVGVEMAGGHVQGVRLVSGRRPQTGCFVNAAGPFLKEVGRMAGLDLPLYAELHRKMAFADSLGILPRRAPLLIWTDPQRLDWTDEERSFLAEEHGAGWVLEDLPAGAHTRPEGGQGSQMLLVLWDYRPERIDLTSPPLWPPRLGEEFPELALRGVSTMIPGLRSYLARISQPRLDGGYYVKTPENRLLCGPTPVDGFYLIGALSGYGLMAACGAGELLAAAITGGPLPPYASAFALSRYEDPNYTLLLETWGDTGQL